MEDLAIAPGITLRASDLEWQAVRSSGPGGQNVNKVSTKVELYFDLARSDALSSVVKARLTRLAAGRLDASGRLRITSQATRSQLQNLEDARNRLAELVRRALHAPKARRVTRPSATAVLRRVEQKRKASEKKRRRRRVERDDS
jgi:ribosome-associated protein